VEGGGRCEGGGQGPQGEDEFGEGWHFVKWYVVMVRSLEVMMFQAVREVRVCAMKVYRW
jgi:hypothetical protein